jgi:hypothetical protein
VTALCLLGAGLSAKIVTAAFTLAWTHTIEHTQWQEDWRVEPDRLVLVEARVKGSGAGMEPAPEAQLRAGWYVWRPELRLHKLTLRRAPEAGDWEICIAGSCQPLSDRLGIAADPVTLRPCAP